MNSPGDVSYQPNHLSHEHETTCDNVIRDV
jgi:hypothetical protein